MSILRAGSPVSDSSHSSSNGFGHGHGHGIGMGLGLGMGIHAPTVDFAAMGLGSGSGSGVSVNPSPSSSSQNHQSQHLDRRILQSPLGLGLDHVNVNAGEGDEQNGMITSRPGGGAGLLFSKDDSPPKMAMTMTPASKLSSSLGLKLGSSSVRTSSTTTTHRTLSIGDAFSLQPPPRKRWTSSSEIHGTPPTINAPLQDSPFIREQNPNLPHFNQRPAPLDDIDVLGGTPSIGRINTGTNTNTNTNTSLNAGSGAGSGSLTPEPSWPNGSGNGGKRASGQSAFSFSFGTPPGSGGTGSGSGNLDVSREYRPRSVSSRSARSARSARSGQSGRSEELVGHELEDHYAELDEEEELELEDMDMSRGSLDHGSISSGTRVRRASSGSGSGSGFGFGTGMFSSLDGNGDINRRSSMGSGKRSSIGVASSKRWSRQLPKRLTPPSGPPPAAPSTPPHPSPLNDHKRLSSSPVKPLPKAPQPQTTVSSHPYGGAATERRASSMTTWTTSSRPSSSRSSVVSNLPSFSKRASVSSAISGTSTASTPGTTTPGAGTGTGVQGHSRPSSSHRSSMAPPPRPAPTFALPPAPDESSPSPPVFAAVPTATTTTTHNKSFRDSVASRAFRLSLMAPKPPPSSTLPPRPDELDTPKSPTASIGSRKGHRRSQSGSTNMSSPGGLYSIPGSPIPPSNMPSSPLSASVDGLPSSASLSRGPLPPTPSLGVNTRAASLKQRLRILSAPSPTSPSAPVPMAAWSTSARPSPPGTPTFMNYSLSSQNGNGNGNGSTHYFEKQNYDVAATGTTFHTLGLGSPTTPNLPAPKVHHVGDEPDSEPEFTSLSPPPRRGSKRMSIPEVGEPGSGSGLGQQEGESRRVSVSSMSVEIANASVNANTNVDVDMNRDGDGDRNGESNEERPFSLSRPGSVMSFGVVT